MRQLFPLGVFLLLFISCEQEVPLNRKQFVSLLIDMHTTDAMVSAGSHTMQRVSDQNAYRYYEDLYNSYGITKVQFDSCLRYYSAQGKLFGRMYDEVIDTLNRRLTDQTAQLNLLCSNDTVNLITDGYRMMISQIPTVTIDTIQKDSTTVLYDTVSPGVVLFDTIRSGDYYYARLLPDTIRIDSVNQYFYLEIKDMTPGYYQLTGHYKFADRNRGGAHYVKIAALSPSNDTLKFRDNRLATDKSVRTINARFYLADSIFNRILIQAFVCDSLRDLPELSGIAYDFALYKTYVTEKESERYRKQYHNIVSPNRTPRLPQDTLAGNTLSSEDSIRSVLQTEADQYLLFLKYQPSAREGKIKKEIEYLRQKKEEEARRKKEEEQRQARLKSSKQNKSKGINKSKAKSSPKQVTPAKTPTKPVAKTEKPKQSTAGKAPVSQRDSLIQKSDSLFRQTTAKFSKIKKTIEPDSENSIVK